MKNDNNFAIIWDLAHRAIRVASYNDPENRHGWWRQHISEHELHPVVWHAVYALGIRPVDWQQLLLEWPHVALKDQTRLAYTRDEQKGRENVQTLTSIGKYLARHWPHVRDDIRRDWAGRFVPMHYEIRDTMEGIITGIEMGPQSCMHSLNGNIPFGRYQREQLVEYVDGTRESHHVSWEMHPYAVYNPEYGWRMAVRTAVDDKVNVLARALVNVSVTPGVYVRSYGRTTVDDTDTNNDEKLNAWLEEQGFVYKNGWPNGLKLIRLEHPDGGLMAPYIDGNNDDVDDDNGRYLVLRRGGKYSCCSSDAQIAATEIVGRCNDCDDEIEGDEDTHKGVYVGEDQDTLVCQICAHNYTYIEGPHGDYYYVPDSDAVYVERKAYDKNNLPDEIVKCEDGAYRKEEDCVYIDGEGYYAYDDDDIVQCADEEWRLRRNCWEDAHSEQWYPDEVSGVDIEEGKYHPDSLKEMIENI